MTRWFLIAFAITIIVCLVQALPAPQQDTSNPVHEAFKNFGESFNKAFESLDPRVNKNVKEAQDKFKDGVLAHTHSRLKKMILETNDNPKPAQ